ncbi:MAG: hypothetical protein LQ352_005736 [Teloschistes flavicans]|nr:MAG: hypothetical protein LQ352_005736 [Teloschistes flavicans]
MTAILAPAPYPGAAGYFYIGPGYQLRYTIPSPTAILMSTSREYIEHTLDCVDSERCFLATGMRTLRREYCTLKVDLGDVQLEQLTEELMSVRDSPRKYTYETMAGEELEVLKNVTIRMVGSNRRLVQHQHRLRDAIDAMKRELLTWNETRDSGTVD